MFLDIDQIIPVKDAEEFLIKRIKKDQENQATRSNVRISHNKRLLFWSKLLKEHRIHSNLFSNISSSKDPWISAGSGNSGVTYIFAITKSQSRIELYIDAGNKELNKKYFDQLMSKQYVINDELGIDIKWKRLDDKISSKLVHVIDMTFYDEDVYDKLISEMISIMNRFEKTFKKYIPLLSK